MRVESSYLLDESARPSQNLDGIVRDSEEGTRDQGAVSKAVWRVELVV